MNKQVKKFNYSKNIITTLVIPALFVILAMIIGAVFGFNKGMDFNGGIIVSIVTDEYNLEEQKEYNKFKNEVDTVIESKGVKGSVYILEKHQEYQNDVLVVKIEYNGTSNEAKSVVDAIKSGLVAKFYAGEEATVENSHLVEVSTFGSSVDDFRIVYTILATLIMMIAICIYVGLRTFSLHASIITLLSSVISSALTFALIMLCRIQINAFSLALIPISCIISAITTFMFILKAQELVKLEKYNKVSNAELCNDAISNSMPVVSCLFATAVIVGLVFAFANIITPAMHLGLSIVACALAVAYNAIFVVPALYALTYCRKVKKSKAKDIKKAEKLSETEVLKETDLDNLVSN